MDFPFENCTFWRKSKRITIIIPDQSYYDLLEKKNCEEFRRTGNCDPVLLCTSTDMETIWAYSVWCLFVNISGHGQCGRKRKQRHLAFV